MGHSELNPIADILGKLPGLHNMSEPERIALAGHFETVSVNRDVVVREGDEADALYVLTRGELEIVKKAHTGREYVVATMTPVSLFGELGLVTYTGRTATVRASGEADLLKMNKLRMQLLLRSTDFEIVSPFRRALIIAMARKLSAANQSLINLAIRAGVAETIDDDDGSSGHVPTDAELELLKAQGQV